MLDKQGVYALLNEKNISYEAVEHPAVYTIEEMLQQNLPHTGAIAKNLFVRDDKKRNYYLLVVPEDKAIQLKTFAQKAGTRRLSFASEEDLGEILHVIRGAVTPFAALNDEEKKVSVYIDEGFRGKLMGVHPNDNTATVYLAADRMFSLIQQHGNPVCYFDI